MGVVEVLLEGFPSEMTGEALACFMFLKGRVGEPEARAANGAGALRGFGRLCAGRQPPRRSLENKLVMVCGAQELGARCGRQPVAMRQARRLKTGGVIGSKLVFQKRQPPLPKTAVRGKPVGRLDAGELPSRQGCGP